MAKQKVSENESVRLSATLSKKTTYSYFSIWLVGETPLITHAWSKKAKDSMLLKQVKGTKPGKEARDPQQDFVDSYYDMGDGRFGFPVTAVKNAILSAAHKDKGIARTAVMAGLYLKADMVRVRPALAGAICDLPLVRIYGSDPEMREDMVKVGQGLNKTASLAYRAQFTVWALKVEGKFNTAVFDAASLAFLIEEGGMACGIGEWRNERRGIFGSFRLATEAEEATWEAFACGKGSLPIPSHMKMAAE